MTYREGIARMMQEWVGVKVLFEGLVYTVVDVDYNGQLLIDKLARFTETTAVSVGMVERVA